MSTVTISKTEYTTLKRRAEAYDRIVAVATDELFAAPPVRSRRTVMQALKSTRRYNKNFLASIGKGLRRSNYFTR